MMATEHAPQSPSAQPSLVPVKPLARRNSSSVVFGETDSTRTGLPFRMNSSEPLITSLINQLISGQRQELRELHAFGHFTEQLCRPDVVAGMEALAAHFLFNTRHFLRQNFIVKLRRDFTAIGQRGVVFEPLPDLRAGDFGGGGILHQVV